MMSRMLSARASAPGPPPGAGEAAPPARFAAEPPRLPRVVLAVRTHLCAGGMRVRVRRRERRRALLLLARGRRGERERGGRGGGGGPRAVFGVGGRDWRSRDRGGGGGAAAPDDEFAAASRRRLADAPGGPRAGPGGAFDEGAAVAGGTAAAVAAAFASAEAAPGRATGRPLARGVNLGAKLLLRRFPARTGTRGEGGEEGGREGSAGQRARAGRGEGSWRAGCGDGDGPLSCFSALSRVSSAERSMATEMRRTGGGVPRATRPDSRANAGAAATPARARTNARDDARARRGRVRDDERRAVSGPRSPRPAGAARCAADAPAPILSLLGTAERCL